MTAIEPPQSIPVPAVKTSLFRRVIRRPLGVVSVGFLVLLVIVAVIGPLLAPLDPNIADIQNVLGAPGQEHLLGTDSAGRDVFSRLLYATRFSLLGALLAVVTALVIGVAAGLIAGYYKGWFEAAAEWGTALNIALPGIVVLLAVRAVVGPSMWIAMFVFGILLAPGYYRLVNASVTAVREELYVDAARVSGLSDGRIISRHILSVVRAPVIVQTAGVAFVAIVIQAGLELLGQGDRSVPNWGGMLADGFTNIYKAPSLMLWPGLAIALTSIALTLLANTMRDVLERTVVVRRRRARAVTTRTGGITAVTMPVQTLSRQDLKDLDAQVISDEDTVWHPDEPGVVRPSEQVLRVRGLRVSYDGPRGAMTEVVHGVSLEIRRGEVHGLIGESGSGKSQTAFSVLDLLPRGGHVTAGEITYEGTRLDTLSEKDRAATRGRRIGYIPQEPMSNLDQAFTIGSQLTEPLRAVMGLSRQEATERVLQLLARVGIPDPKKTFDSYPFQISGGMAQRVLIAGAVSMEPDLIIADEPTTALDVTVQAEVLDLLRDLQKERGMAMLLVTHNFGVVADLCDQVSVMQDGRIVESGPVRTILRTPATDYTKALLGALLDGGPARPPLALAGSGIQEEPR